MSNNKFNAKLGLTVGANATSVIDDSGNITAGTLNTTGNVTLGDASTDTVTVNGYMGVGGAPVAGRLLTVVGTLSASNPVGIADRATLTATGGSVAFKAGFGNSGGITLNTGGAVTTASTVSIDEPVITVSTGSLTNAASLYISEGPTEGGTINANLLTTAAAGTNKWNIYASGTAANYFAGQVRINGFTQSGSAAYGTGAKLVIESSHADFVASGTYSELDFLRHEAGAIVSNGHQLGRIVARGWNGTAYNTAAAIDFYVNGTPGASNDMPGRITFSTTADGSATLTERVRIDSSGNVGVGVTPNSSSIATLEIDNSGSTICSTSGAETQMSANAYYNSGWKYATSTGAANYYQSVNTHSWRYAASGTAGNAITWINAMHIDSSGNVGIGTTTPSYQLSVAKGGGGVVAAMSLDTYDATDGNSSELFFRKSGSSTLGSVAQTADGEVLGIIRGTGVNSSSAFANTAMIDFIQDGVAGATYVPGKIQFRTGTNAAAASTRMTIGSSGVVHVGTFLSTSGGWGTGDLKVEGNTSHGLSAVSHNNTDGNASFVQIIRSLGTGASPIAVGSNTLLGAVNWGGYDGINAAYTTAAEIRTYVDGTVSSGVVPGALSFRTASNGGSLTERLRIDSAGIITHTANNAEIRITESGTYYASIKTDSSGGLTIAADPSAASANSRIIFSIDGSERMRIDPNGSLLIGDTSSREYQSGFYAKTQISGTGSEVGISLHRYTATAASAPTVFLAKSANASNGSHTLVSSGDTIGNLRFSGSDGATFIPAAQITGQIDGTAALNSMPGRLVFSTTTSGNSTATERMRIDSSGRVLIGRTSNNASFSGLLQIEGTSGVDPSIVRWTNASGAGGLYFGKSRGTSVGSNAIVQLNDNLGSIQFYGDNGSTFSNAGYIIGFVDGTPGASNDMPGRIEIWTSGDGSATPSKRVSVQSTGNSVFTPDGTNVVATISSTGVAVTGTVSVGTATITESSSDLTLTSTDDFIVKTGGGARTAFSCFDSGSAIENYSGGGLLPSVTASYNLGASGYRWNNVFSVAGNFSGDVILGDATTDTVTVNGYMGVGGAVDSSRGLNVVNSALTGTSQIGIASLVTGTSAATTLIRGVAARADTAAAAYTASDVVQFYAINSNKGAGSTITNQHGLYIADQTQGTNNYGITSLVSSGSNKWNIYASGTAANYFAGNVGVGTNAPIAKIHVESTTAFSGVQITAANNSFSYVNLGDVDDSNIGQISYDHTGNYLTFTANNAERVRIDSSGNVLVGTSSDIAVGGGSSSGIQAFKSANGFLASFTHGSNTTIGAVLTLGKTRGTTADSYTIVQSGDTVGVINFAAADGTDLQTPAAEIRAAVDGTPGSNDMPGRLIFSTTADGASSPTERMRIDSTGNVLVGTATTTNNVPSGTTCKLVSVITGDGVYGGQALTAYAGTTAPTTRGCHMYFQRSRGTTDGSMTAVASGDSLVRLIARGSDGTNFRAAASIDMAVDAAVTGGGTDDMPGRITFHTSADGTSNLTERMRIDSSGNVGIGVAPSAWSGYGQPIVEVPSTSGMWSAGPIQWHGANSYYTGGSITYKTTARASYFGQNAGQFFWYSAASGTAGTPITFTQILSVDKDKSLALQGAASAAGCGISFPATQVASSNANTLDDYREASATLTATGMTTSPTGTAEFVKTGNMVVMQIPAISGTSNATTFTLTGVPTEFRPSTSRVFSFIGSDNGGASFFGRAILDTSGVITLYTTAASGAWTNSGTKQTSSIYSVSYII